MAQPIRGSSPERNSLAPVTSPTVTALATSAAVSVRSNEVPPFLIVEKNCHEGVHFDQLSSEYENQSIHTLKLSESHLFMNMWQCLLNYLDRSPVLYTLDLSKVEMGMENKRTLAVFKYVMRALKNMPTNLLMRNCSINCKAIEPIASRLKVDQKLQTLDLAENDLCAADIQLIADSLQHNRALSGLNLAGNKLDTAAIPALTHLLANASALQQLDLSDNLFTPEDKAALFQANAVRAGAPVALVL